MLLEAELKKAGLPPKQAAIYLTLLGLGPSTIQQIARKANIPRATTYVLIDALLKIGLVTKIKARKRPVFIVEQPQQLLTLMESRQQQLANYQQDIRQLIPRLQAMYALGKHGPHVRSYPGRKGLQIMRQEMTRQCSDTDMWYNLAPAEQVFATFGKHNHYCRERAAKGIWSKVIFTARSRTIKQQLLQANGKQRTERRCMPSDTLLLTTGITISQDKVALASYTGQEGGLLLQDQSLAQTLRQFFEIAWNQLADDPAA